MSIDILRFRAALVSEGRDPSGAFGAFGSRPRDFVVLPARSEAPSTRPAQAD